MKRIGLVGGTTPESTVEYYRALIALGRKSSTDPLCNPEIVIVSVNLAEIVARQRAGRTDEVVETFAAAIDSLRLAGAELAALTANTPHVYFEQLASRAEIPLISILDATCNRTASLGLRKVLLLGTEMTMGSSMYPEKLAGRGIEVVTPDHEERAYIDGIIYGELSVGVISDATRRRFVEICERHIRQGRVDGIVLGCTEIPLLLTDGDVPVPMIDTTAVHAEAIFAVAVS